MQFPIVPAGISVALGAADGYLASHDIKANGGTSPPLSKSKALWLQGGAVGVGLVGEFMRWHPDITESLMFTGSALFAREFTFKLAQQGQTTPAVAQGYRAYVPAGNVQATPMMPNLQQGATAAGFMVRQSAGSVA